MLYYFLGFPGNLPSSHLVVLLPSLPSHSLRSPPFMCEEGCFPGIPPSSHLVVSCSPLAPSCSLSLAMILCFAVPTTSLLCFAVPTTYFGARVLPSSLPFLPACFVSLPLLPSRSLRSPPSMCEEGCFPGIPLPPTFLCLAPLLLPLALSHWQ